MVMVEWVATDSHRFSVLKPQLDVLVQRRDGPRGRFDPYAPPAWVAVMTHHERGIIVGAAGLSSLQRIQDIEDDDEAFVRKGGRPDQIGLYVSTVYGHPGYKHVVDTLFPLMLNLILEEQFNVEYVALHVDLDHPWIAALYARHGFQHLDAPADVSVDPDPGPDRIVMVRDMVHEPGLPRDAS